MNHSAGWQGELVRDLVPVAVRVRSRNLGPDAPAEAFMEDFFGGTVGIFPDGQEIDRELKDQTREEFMDFKSSEGRVRMDLIKGEDGGSLVIDSDEGQVRFDLKKTDNGGFLAIDTDEGQVRFDLVKREGGGSLVINSDEGQVRFDVKGGRMVAPWSSRPTMPPSVRSRG